jgi:hypothetical protein
MAKRGNSKKQQPQRERRGKVTNPPKVTPPSPAIFSNSGGWWAGWPAARSRWRRQFYGSGFPVGRLRVLGFL